MELFYFVQLLFLASFVVVNVASIEMSVAPAQSVHPGTTVIVTCEVDRARVANSLTWLRRIGTLDTRIGTNQFTASGWNSRYRLQKLNQKSHTIDEFQLTITDIKVEDTATIVCQLQDSEVFVKTTVAVCEDLSSGSCSCILEKGFVTAECFDEPDSVTSTKSHYNKVVGGLVACLFIVLVVGIVLFVIVSRDCLRAANDKRQQLVKSAKESRLARRSPDRQQLDDVKSDEPATEERAARGRPGTTSQQSVDNLAFEVDVHSPAVLPTSPATYASPYAPAKAGYQPQPRSREAATAHGYSSKPQTLEPASPHSYRSQQHSPAADTPPSYQSQVNSPAARPYNAQQANGDVSQHDVSQRDVSQRDVGQRDVSQRDVSLHDVSQRDVSPRDVRPKTRAAYTDVARDVRPGNGQAMRGAPSQPRQLDFTAGSSYQNVNQDNNNGPYIDKTDMIV